jgi:signal transduction histidine kinase
MYFIIRSRIKQKQINRLLEQKNEKISTQAENLEKLDKFKEAMTSMLAHDLKNPLNTITSISDDPGKLEQKQIKQAGEKMLNMVVNLLDISKYETSTMPLKLNNWCGKTLVENVIQRINLLVENKFITIQNQVAGNIYVRADHEILERVFENLLTNAIKYSPVNGKIDITSSLINLPILANVHSPDSKFLFSLEIWSFGVPSLYENTLTLNLVASNSTDSPYNSLSKLLSNAINTKKN